MSAQRTCSECGAPLPEDAPRNGCPKCLLAPEESQPSEGEADAGSIPSASITAKAKTEIIVRKDDHPLARYVLAPGEYLIGRGADCHVRVDSADVSQRHA